MINANAPVVVVEVGVNPITKGTNLEAEVSTIVISATEEQMLAAVVDYGPTLPAPTAQYRRGFFRLESGTGVQDKCCICIKDANDDYIWCELTLIPI